MGKSDQSGRDVGPETSSAARDANDSFVKKMTSRVSELIPNTLSRWFSSQRPLVRRRESSSSSNDDDDDEEPSSKRPPTKRPCLPADRKRYADAASIGYRLSNGSTVADRTKTEQPKPFADYEDATEGRFLKLYERSADAETSADDGAGTSVGTRASALRAELERTARKAVSGYDRSDETANGAEKSESEDSTSGCSSMAQRNRPERSEEAFEARRRRYDPSPNVSSERSLFTKLNLRADSSASSRRPSFDVSSFGSPSLVDRTLTSERITNSPFYKGITRFGGASAALRLTPSPYRPDRRPRIAVDVRPARDVAGRDVVELSKTARRILDALEHVSSPIDDVRNMPCPNITRDRPRTPYSRMHAPPATKPLVIPTVCDLLRMKRVDELRESTETVRDITARTEPAAKVRSFDAPEYKLRSDDAAKRSSKIRPKISKVRGVRADANEYSERVELPEVSLKIESMPKFDIAIPAPKPPVGQFRFASPSDIVVGSVAPTRHKNAVDTFEFSAPIYVDEFDRKRKRTPSPVLKRRPLSSVKNDESIERNSVVELPAENEKRPAVPPKATWECDTCMIANEATDETRCVACRAPRPGSSLPSERPFEDWFKSQSDKWKCDVCLVRNATTDTKCVACTTERPGTAKPQEKQQQPQQPRDKDASKAPTGFGDAFKPPADTWSCDVCLIRNKSGADLCAACDSPRPGAKSSKPAAVKVVEWECPTCAVRNADSSHECVCCRSAKPGSRPKVVDVPGGAPPIGTFKFGIDKAGVDVKETVAPPPSGFVFGKTDVTVTTVSTAGFTFGIPAGEKKVDANTTGKFSFGIPAAPEKTTGDISDKTDSTIAAREPKKDAAKEEKPETVAEKPIGQVSKDTQSGSFTLLKKDSDMNSTNNNNRFIFGSSEVGTSNVTESTVDTTAGKEPTSTGTKTVEESENVKQSSPEPVETVKAATPTGPAKTDRASVVAPAFAKPAPPNQFAFGVPSNTPSSSSKTLLFGSEPAAAPIPAFVAKPQSVVEPEKSVFGGETLKPADKPFVPESQPFQSNSSTADMFSNAKPLFGSCLTPSFRRCTKPVFGSKEPAKPATAASPGTFLKPSTNGYAFDTTSPAENKPSPPPLFTFGAAASAANDDSKPAKVQKFPFSAGPIATAPTFSFGGGGAETKPFAAFPFGGGGKTDQPSFGNVGGAAAPPPMFGSTPTVAAAGGSDPFAGFGATSKTPMFNFGAGAAQSPAKIFSFGNPQASAPAASASAGTTAFTFGAQSSPAPPSFDPNTKPMFNFSGSSAPTAFTARPVPGTTPAVAQRKVKRAVRRTQR